MIYLKLDNISICETRAELGDAAFTFYRVGFKTAPEGAKNHAPLYHSHFYYECHILDGGESSFLIQGQAVLAEADTMVIIPPYTGHYPFQSDGVTSDRVICMLLEQTEPATGEFSYFKRTLNDICNKPITVSAVLFLFFAQNAGFMPRHLQKCPFLQLKKDITGAIIMSE